LKLEAPWRNDLASFRLDSVASVQNIEGRVACMYAYQVIVLDELSRHGVRAPFIDAFALDNESSHAHPPAQGHGHHSHL
jgi:hypothetical protein